MTLQARSLRGWQRRDAFLFSKVTVLVFVLSVLLLTTTSFAAGPPDAEVLPPGVAVRLGPAPGAPVIATLPAGAQVEVLFTQRGPAGSWAQVVLPSGATGFIPEANLRRLATLPQWRSVGGGSQSSRSVSRMAGNALAVPLRRIGGVLLVASRINGQVSTNFIVDTGASVVTISHALADRLGLEYTQNPKQRLITPSGIMLSPRVVLDTVHVPDEAGAGLTRVEAVVATLPATPPDIGGLLGQSFLRHFHVTVDGERAVMHLESIGATGATRR